MSVAPGTIIINQCQCTAMTPTGSNHAFRCLECHGFEVVHTSLCTCMNHGKLPADLVTRDGMIRRKLRCVGNDVKIRKRGLDHDDVGAFGHITLLPSNQQRDNGQKSQMRRHSQ